MSRTKFNVSGNAERNYEVSVQESTDNVSVSAASGACTVVLSQTTAGATTQGSPIISEVFCSYAGTSVGATTPGRLTIADSSGTLFDQDLGVSNKEYLFDPPISSQVQTSALTVTLAGLTGATAKLVVHGWFEL